MVSLEGERNLDKDSDTQYHVAREEEVSVMLPQTKERQGLLTTPRNKERERHGTDSLNFQEGITLPTPLFYASGIQNS